MKVSSLLGIYNSTRNLLDFFEDVETVDQLVSRLERLKKTKQEELLDSIEDLREAAVVLADDTFEMGGSSTEDLEEDESDDLLGDDFPDLEDEEPEKEVIGETQEEKTLP
jgi:hypothetical protein